MGEFAFDLCGLLQRLLLGYSKHGNGFHKMLAISQLGEQILSSQE
jgi:hypothetical protein